MAVNTQENLAWYFSTVFTGLFGLCSYMVWYYAETGFPWVTYATNIFGYFVSYGIILVVPIDMATVIYDRQSTNIGTNAAYNGNIQSLSEAYSFFFGVIVVLGGFILVFEEYYNTDGYFSVLSKAWSSFLRMIYDTILMVVAGAIILGILIHQKVVPGDSTALKLTAVIVTNTLYEGFLMFLLGYGMVEYPRTVWNISNLEFTLQQTQMKAASDFKDIGDAQFDISVEVANVLQTNLKLTGSVSEEVKKAMEVLLSECPPEFRSSKLGTAALDKKGQVTISTLGALRGKLRYAKSRYRMAQAKVEGTKLKAYELEDMLEAKKRNTEGERAYDGVRAINWSLTGKPSTEWEYNWQMAYKPVLARIGAIVLALLSTFSFVGVICSMNGIDARRSVYFIAVHDETASQGGIAVFIFLTLGYAVYITFWSLSQLKLGGLMVLVPGKTTPDCLSFNVRMVSKLAAPLVFFYLGWIAENGINSGPWVYNKAPDLVVNGVTISQSIDMPSAFSNFYQLKNVKIIRNTFGTIFPLIMIGFMVMTITKTYNWLMVKIKLPGLQFGTPLVTSEQLKEGMRQLDKTKRTTINAARRSRFKSFLMRMTQGDAVDEHGGDKEPVGFWESLCGDKEDVDVNANDDPADDTPEEPKFKLPEACEGAAQLQEGRLMSHWTDLFVEVRAPGLLHFFLTRADADIDKPYPAMKQALDLTQIIDFQLDSNKIQLCLPAAKHVIRLKDATEASVWKGRLLKWKEFNSEYGAEYVQHERQAGTSALDDLNVDDVNLSEIYLGNESDDDRDRGRNKKSASPAFATNTTTKTTGAGAGKGGKGTTVEMGAVTGKDGKAAAGKKSSSPAFGASTSTSSIVSGGFSSSNYAMSLGEVKPSKLEGYVEMKDQKKGLFASEHWDRRYLVVHERQRKLLVYMTANPAESPILTVDLPACIGIEYYSAKDGKGTDTKRFNVKEDDNHKDYKFRVATDLEGKRWVEGLNEWKDWLLMNYV